jgi:hypothetical protein
VRLCNAGIAAINSWILEAVSKSGRERRGTLLEDEMAID